MATTVATFDFHAPSPHESSLGAVLGVRGSEARVGLPAPALSDSMRATVGTFLAIAAEHPLAANRDSARWRAST